MDFPKTCPACNTTKNFEALVSGGVVVLRCSVCHTIIGKYEISADSGLESARFA